MKYIRTDKNIFEVVGETDLVYKIIGASRKRDNVYSRTKKLNDVVATGDSIKELCDELVIHNPSNDGDFYPKYFVYKNKWENMLKPMSDYQKSKGIEIYGAIWTDKGLIYVAKMNEKGELELI